MEALKALTRRYAALTRVLHQPSHLYKITSAVAVLRPTAHHHHHHHRATPPLISTALNYYSSSSADKPEPLDSDQDQPPSPSQQDNPSPPTPPPLPQSMSQTSEPLPSELDEPTPHSGASTPDKLYKSIELEVLAYEPATLDSYQWFVLTSAAHLGLTVGKCWSPHKSDKHRWRLLKSAFVHKKHVVHYEVRTHHRFITFRKVTGSTADTFLEYIERNLPEGVGLKVTRVEVKSLPEYVGKPGSKEGESSGGDDESLREVQGQRA